LWPRARSRPTIILAVCSWNASARFLFIHSQFRSHITWTTKKKPTIYGFHIWSTRGAGDLQSQKYYGDACDAQSIGVKQKIAKVRAVKKSSKWQKKKSHRKPRYTAPEDARSVRSSIASLRKGIKIERRKRKLHRFSEKKLRKSIAGGRRISQKQ